MKSIGKAVANVGWYLVVFILIQMTIFFVIQSIIKTDITYNLTALIIATAISNIITLFIFTKFHWVLFQQFAHNINSVKTLLWIIIMALSTQMPSMWMIEHLNAAMPDNVTNVLTTLLSNGWGVIVVALLTPIVEEFVFRGAILRKLQQAFHQQSPWIAIAISALLFGLVHGNMAQMPHAFLLGLLLGWLYVRTNSLIPSILFHITINSSTIILNYTLPNAETSKLIDTFGGNALLLWSSLSLSLIIFVISIQRTIHNT